MLLSGADIAGSVDGKRVPSPSSSGQSPISEPNDWTLWFGRKPGREGGKSKEGGKTGFGSALCSASAGGQGKTGLGMRAEARRRERPNACRSTGHVAVPVGSYLWQ